MFPLYFSLQLLLFTKFPSRGKQIFFYIFFVVLYFVSFNFYIFFFLFFLQFPFHFSLSMCSTFYFHFFLPPFQSTFSVMLCFISFGSYVSTIYFSLHVCWPLFYFFPFTFSFYIFSHTLFYFFQILRINTLLTVLFYSFPSASHLFILHFQSYANLFISDVM